MDVCLDSDTASYAVTASDDFECGEFAVYGLDREHTAVAGTEPCLEDIFFASRSHPPLMKQKVLAGIEERCEVVNQSTVRWGTPLTVLIL